MKRLNLKLKIVLLTLGVGLLPLATVGIYSYFKASSSLEDAKTEKLEAVMGIKESSVKRYFVSIRDQILTFSEDKMVIDAMRKFRKHFREVRSKNNISSRQIDWMRQQLATYYNGPFSEEYKKQNGSSPPIGKFLGGLDDDSIALQYFYIQDNANPLGSKHILDAAKEKSNYSKTHANYHPPIRSFLEKFEYYDIFLVDPETGDIVYSVFKELDYSTSLINGPYAQTNFGEAFRTANALTDKDDFVLMDYKKYPPSYEAPASFIASPIFDGDEKVGVAIFQMPIDRLNHIMGELSGMGESGETLLIGADHLMRSDSRLKAETHSVVASFRNPETGRFDMGGLIEDALAGNKAVKSKTDYLGNEVMTAYNSVDILGKLKWVLVAKIDKAEAFKSVHDLRFWISTVAIIAGILIGLVGIYFGRGIANPILQITELLNTGSSQVRSVSGEIASSSSQLSETTTQQSAAIEETVSSMEEMAAMLGQTSGSADDGLRIAQESEKEANNGKNVISKMLSAMDEIQESNSRLESIVKAIEEIKDKTRVINDIVSETRLLSFNASIEAARAGVHGKGFAVVAEEVGKLAAMSGKAAEEIRNLLESSTSQVDEIVTNTKERVSGGKEISKECERAFISTADSLNKILHSIESINSASKEQESGVKQTNKAMNEMESITQQNSTNADTLRHQAADLKVNAGELTQAISDLRRIILGTGTEQKDSFTPPSSGTSSKHLLSSKEPTAPRIVKSDSESPSVDQDEPDRSDSRWKAA